MNGLQVFTPLLVLALLALLPFEGSVHAQSAPRPVVFAGKATIDGSPVFSGTFVSAWIDGSRVASASANPGGGYALRIPQTPGRNFTGKEVIFMIGSLIANTKAVWQPGGGGELNLVATTPGSAQPVRPAVFGGRVTIDGRLAPDGTTVSAIIGGVVAASGSVVGGRYGITISQPRHQSYSGMKITFMAGDRVLAETAIWEAGGGIELDLSAVSVQMPPSAAFASVIAANNLERVWHFEPSVQDMPPEYGWFLYDPRPAFALANDIDYIRSGEFYWVSVHRDQPGTVLGGKVVHLYRGWNPITWP